MDGLGVYLATDYVASEYVAARKWEIEHERSVRLARAESEGTADPVGPWTRIARLVRGLPSHLSQARKPRPAAAV